MISGKILDQEKVKAATLERIGQFVREKKVFNVKEVKSVDNETIRDISGKLEHYRMKVLEKRVSRVIEFAQEYLSDAKVSLSICVDDGYTPAIGYVDKDNYATLYVEDSEAYATLSFVYAICERGRFAKETLANQISGINDKSFKVLSESANTEYRLRKSIFEERKKKTPLEIGKLKELVLKGAFGEASSNLIYYTRPKYFKEKTSKLMKALDSGFDRLKPVEKENAMKFIVKFSLDTKSFLVEWSLKNEEFHGDNILSDKDLDEAFKGFTEFLENLEGENANLSESLRLKYFEDNVLRLKAEGCSEEEAKAEVEKLLGKSLKEYVTNMVSNFSRSNLTEISHYRKNNVIPTELGNDYAAFLDYTMWLGVSFVTSNPVLIETAWKISPEYWMNRAKSAILKYYTSDKVKEILSAWEVNERRIEIERMTSIITMEVVYENAKLLRDIFLLTEGRTGQVSLQLNPRNCCDTEALINDAHFIWSELSKAFNGVPNIVFKLPGTYAGLKAAEILTKEGIGVNITVNFGLFQELRFAEVLNKSSVLASYLTVMNGRLVAPVAEELKNVLNGEEASKLAGVAVVKDLNRKLYDKRNNGGQEFDPARIKVLVASLRIYPEGIPDITEDVGTAIITIFPNVRRAFDLKERVIEPNAIEKPVDEKKLKTLCQSEVFKQAYYTLDKPKAVEPKKVITLEDDVSVLAWPPVARTLKQFNDAFESLAKSIEELIKTF